MSDKEVPDPLILRIDLTGDRREQLLFIKEKSGINAYAEIIRMTIKHYYDYLKYLQKMRDEKLLD